jgi:Fur family peroxide stress response transcriptional regulator
MLKKFNSISLATIYKNIHLMIENALIQEVKIPHQKSVYELTKEAHSHLVCDKCGMVEDITLDLSALSDLAAHSTDFQITKTNLVFSGLCKKCQ